MKCDGGFLGLHVLDRAKKMINRNMFGPEWVRYAEIGEPRPYEKTFGPNHPDLADVLDNLAGLYKDNGRYADASALSKRSMAIRAKAGSPS